VSKDIIGQTGAVIFSTIMGTATNTIGVLSLALLRGYIPNLTTTMVIGATHGIPEIIIAVLITVAIIKAIKRADVSSL
jgi:uncharacterized membrane protein